MLGVFASVWVGSQFTPVGWAADALVLVMTIGGCILLGPHLLEVGSLLHSFYKKATNAGRNEAQYRSVGEDFARVVTLLGVDVLMVLVFHVAKAPVNRLVVRVKQGGLGRLPGSKPAPVEESVPMKKSPGKGKPGKLIAGSPQHKAQRWADYQKKGGKYTYERWSKQYDTNMRNATHGLSREAQYRDAMSGVSETVKTPFTNRQIDISIPDRGYMGQLKTGKVSLTEQAKIDIAKDAELVKQGFEVEYILEKGASKPFLDALKKVGVKHKIGPQIPTQP